MMRDLRTLAVCVLLAGCGFQHGGAYAPPPELDFAHSTSLQDHASGMVMVPVVLSKPADAPVFFSWSVSGGTAVEGTDYTIVSDPMLAIQAGDAQTSIVLNIPYTTTEGPDTTLDLSLDMPDGAVLGTTSQHVMTISGVVLPRVTFSQATSQASETMDDMVTVQMDKMSPVGTSVDVLLGGTAIQGTDYTFPGGTVTFAAGQTTSTLVLGVKRDNEFNSNVSVILTLDNAQKMIIGTPAQYTHTIVEADPMPTASFALGAAAAKETAGTVTVNVTLSAPSRLITTVPFAVDASTTATAADYTIATASPLTFNPGETVKTVTINLIDDGVADNGKLLALALGAPTNATLGTTKTYALTIQDDDQTCLGANTFAFCVQKPLAGSSVNLTGPLDTTNDMRCTTQFSGWTGQPASCFIVAETITVTGTLSVQGSKPLVLVASNTITVSGTLDAASHVGGKTGPGAPFAGCAAAGAGGNDMNGGGGGSGGSFRSSGGTGGSGNGGNGSGGGSAGAVGAPTVLRAGCNGHLGGTGTGAGAAKNPGAIGAGGGAVMLAAGISITLMNTAVVNVSGAGAGAAALQNSSGGSGGGSGGMVRFDAPTINAGGSVVMANGGGGASGVPTNTPANPGADALTGTPTQGGAGGAAAGQGGAGGDGFGSAAAAQSGSSASGNRNPGGGGGGGGGGEVQSTVTLNGATVSAGP